MCDVVLRKTKRKCKRKARWHICSADLGDLDVVRDVCSHHLPSHRGNSVVFPIPEDQLEGQQWLKFTA